jgi:hypothetical protein
MILVKSVQMCFNETHILFVEALASLCWICAGSVALGQIVLQVFRFSRQYHSTSAPYLLIYISLMLYTVAIGSIVKGLYLTVT